MSGASSGDGRPPTAEEQLAFLRSFQRLLDEGSFVASYKFALLHAIADLCVVEGDDSGDRLELSVRQVAEQFVRLYWRQVAPFVAGEEHVVLKQNTGRQAAVVRELRERHETYQGALGRLEADTSEWRSLVRMVERTVKVMPLWKLQTVGSERLVDLRSFLFGGERSSLTTHRSLLRDLQEGECFYCVRPIRRGGHVDHFIPWSRYPLDLGHNFVLAHEGCNSKKSNLLAAEEHLSRWAERNERSGEALTRAFDAHGILHDLRATRSVAVWAYEQTERAGGQVRVGGAELRELGPGWRECLVGH